MVPATVMQTATRSVPATVMQTATRSVPVTAMRTVKVLAPVTMTVMVSQPVLVWLLASTDLYH
ncbi:hypothetical protein D3C71_2170880 [compost metagenome]